MHNWATEVRKLLGESQCNSDQMNFNRKDFLDSAWDALAARELEEWSRSIWTSPGALRQQAGSDSIGH